MPPIQEFTPCVQESRRDYPDPNSDFKWSEVESIALANREAIQACHVNDWPLSTPGETYELNTEFLRAVQFFQQASEADPEGGKKGHFRLSRLSPQRQAEIFHDAYDILYDFEPYEAPPRLSKWGYWEVMGGAAGLLSGLLHFAFRPTSNNIPDRDDFSLKRELALLAGFTLAGVAIAKGLREWSNYDLHEPHFYSYDELMAIETEVPEEGYLDNMKNTF